MLSPSCMHLQTWLVTHPCRQLQGGQLFLLLFTSGMLGQLLAAAQMRLMQPTAARTVLITGGSKISQKLTVESEAKCRRMERGSLEGLATWFTCTLVDVECENPIRGWEGTTIWDDLAFTIWWVCATHLWQFEPSMTSSWAARLAARTTGHASSTVVGILWFGCKYLQKKGQMSETDATNSISECKGTDQYRCGILDCD